MTAKRLSCFQFSIFRLNILSKVENKKSNFDINIILSSINIFLT